RRLQRMEKKFSENLGRLLSTGRLSDVVLLVGGKEYPAHKAILGAQSEVFAAMFEHDTLERNQGRVEIPDIDSDFFEELLHFIYTGKANLHEYVASPLLSAADKVTYLQELLMSNN